MINEKEEIWKEIPGHDLYEASNFGRIRSKDKIIHKIYASGVRQTCKINSKIFNQKIPTNGDYIRVSVSGRVIKSHRLVASAFFGKIPNGMVVNHKNGIKSDNRIENLEIVTSAENNMHALQTGLKKNNGGKIRLGPEEYLAIKFFYSRKRSKFNHNEILAKIFDRSRGTIRKIASGNLDHMILY